MNSFVNLKVKILSYTDNSQPGWVRCCFNDINEQSHFFEDKVPILTEEYLDEKSNYPQKGSLKCNLLNRNSDVITIDISNPFCLEDENGKTIFEVFVNQIEESI